MCHQKLDHPWKEFHIPTHRAVAEACWGFLGVSALIWNVIFHICLSTAAKFLATVTKGIVLFHGSATPPLLWLSTHKSVKIEISGLRMSEAAAIFQQLVWNVSVVGSTAFQQEEKALVPTDRGPPETRYGAFIKKDTS